MSFILEKSLINNLCDQLGIFNDDILNLYCDSTNTGYMLIIKVSKCLCLDLGVVYSIKDYLCKVNMSGSGYTIELINNKYKKSYTSTLGFIITKSNY